MKEGQPRDLNEWAEAIASGSELPSAEFWEAIERSRLAEEQAQQSGN